MPIIKSQLIDPKFDKSSDKNIPRTSALETIDFHQVIHAYTDGTAFKGTTFAGFGVILQFPDGSSFDYSDACGRTCSNYDAEIKALRTAVELVHQSFEVNEHSPTHTAQARGS